MGLEIAPIERSRCVDSQAWCFFFSTQKNRDVGASRSRVFREKLHYFLPWDLFQKEIPPCVFSLAATGRGSLCASEAISMNRKCRISLILVFHRGNFS